MYCDTCLVRLCTDCIDTHILHDECRHHRIVQFQTRQSALLQANCAIHMGKPCDMFCYTCNIRSCPKCILSNHQGHNYWIFRQELGHNRQTLLGQFPKILCFSNEEIQHFADVLLVLENTLKDAPGDAFACRILKYLHVDEFLRKIQFLQSKVVLAEASDLCYSNTGEGFVFVCINKVEVRPSGNTLLVLQPETPLDQFTSICHLPKAFLVSSNSESIENSKLSVYREYRDIFEDRYTRIYHELDSPKEFLFFSAKYTIDTLTNLLVKVIRTEYDIAVIVENTANEVFTREEILRRSRNIKINFGSIYERRFSSHVRERVQQTENLSGVSEYVREDLRDDALGYLKEMLDIELTREIKEIYLQEIFTNRVRRDTLGFLGIATQFFIRQLAPIIWILLTIFTFGGYLFTIFREPKINSSQWRVQISETLYKKILDKKDYIVWRAAKNIKDICDQTFAELMVIISMLKGVKSKIPLDDQNEIFNEWMLGGSQERDNRTTILYTRSQI
ncbi:uncharacterized protein LOC134238117 [Saccostrea cucullata]|uniref:uncharacterized protein LOC134238117 n=1 Tax=Saccostrea cuccullata TaxID=36930 RepID=UPI002ED0FF6B